MRRARFLLFTFALLNVICCFSSSLQAQAPSVEVVVLIEKALLKHGAAWASGQITDWISDGKLTLFTVRGPQATFDITVTRKGKSQIQRVTRQPSGEIREGSDGSRTWHALAGQSVAGAQGRTQQFLESQTVRSIQTLFNYQAEGLILRDAGVKGAAHWVEAEDKQGRKTAYAIDQQSSAITELRFVTGRSRDIFNHSLADHTDRYVFSDFQIIQGLLTPFKIERYSDGFKVEEMQFNNVRYNTSVRDDVFRP